MPSVFDHETAKTIAGSVDTSLMGLMMNRSPVPGEVIGPDGAAFIYLYVPLDPSKGYRFVIIDFSTNHPKPQLFGSRKQALSLLGDLIDILSCHTVDWCQMSIPSE